MFNRFSQVLLRRQAALRAFQPVRFYSVHSKYAGRLAERARKQGITVDELLEQAKPKAEEVKKNDVADLVEQAKHFTKKSESAEVADTPEAQAGEAVKKATSGDGSKTTMELDSFIDVEKFKLHDKKGIELLWKTRFLNTTGAFSGSMLPDPFSRLYINARKYPTFVLPLPHKAHGIELHYVQWSFVSSQTVYCLITSLAQYKLHGEYAHPHTTFMLHTDLAADKGVILTNSVVQENQITPENAALLILNLQRFYTAEPTTPQGLQKLDLLRQFNTGDTNFSVDTLIESTETLD